jgi:hypothetical protein
MPDMSNACEPATLLKKPKATLETDDLNLKEDKKLQDHKRDQKFADAIVNVKVMAIYLPYVLAGILSVAWIVCCCINAYEIKTGIEDAGKTLVILLVGTLLSKCF